MSIMRLKDYFIPSRSNKFHPIGLRPLGLFLTILALLAMPFTYNLSATGKVQVLGYATNITISGLHSVSNGERTNAGVAQLKLNNALSSAAFAKAQDMFADNYWAHVSPDGTTPWWFMSNAGYNWQYAAENLAKNFDTSAGVVNGWMNSASHRAAMLNGDYVDVGYAVVDGVLQGSETTLVVAMYGKQKAVAAPTTTKTSTSKQTTAPAKTTTAEPVTTPAEKDEEPTLAKKEVVKEAEPTTTQEPAKAATTTPQVITDEGEVEGTFIELPVRAYQSLNWGQKASLFIISILGLLFILKHTAVWRQRRKGIQHVWLRAHPLSQATLLIVIVIVTLASGAGVIL